MWSWIADCAALVAAHPGLAILVAFAAAIIEAVAVLGILIPGTPILMAVAGAAAVAGLPMAPILVVSIVGAILGDFISSGPPRMCCRRSSPGCRSSGSAPVTGTARSMRRPASA